MQENFIEFIKDEKSRGKTILLSSHIFNEVDATCDRIAIIKDGHIVSEFIANDLKHATTKYYEITFLNKTNYKKFSDLSKENTYFKILNKDENKNYYFISCDDKDFNNVKETLKDYFMKFYKEDLDYKKGAL